MQINNELFYLFYVCECFTHVYVGVPSGHLGHREGIGALDPLELELSVSLRVPLTSQGSLLE